jgi:spermidine/putrescine-binding protein
MVTELVDEGLLGRIRAEAVPNLRNLTFRFSDPSYDPGGTHSVAYTWGTVGLGLAADTADVDQSWGLVFDPGRVANYPAGISLLDNPRHSIGAALKFLGYSLNSTSTDELKEAADLIAGLDDLPVTYNGESYDQLVASGAVTVAQGRSDRLHTETLSFVTPVEGAAIWARAMAVPANAEHPCTAHTFINYLLEPENGAALANWTQQASPNRAALFFVDPVLLEDRSVYPGQEADRRLEFVEDLGDFEEEYAEALAVARS